MTSGIPNGGMAIGPFASGQFVGALSDATEGLVDKQENMDARLKVIEKLLAELDESLKGIIQTEIRKSYVRDRSMSTLNGMQIALCVATDDPYKEGRVRFWHPALHNGITPEESTDWAKPISCLGGFDDSGVHWPPPAGSLLALTFVNGNRNAAFYMGTIWNRERNSPPTFAIPIPEYAELWQGHRGGYLFGDQNGPESQVLPPSNTSSYNGFDITNTESLETDLEAVENTTTPTHYQLKTNGKHTLRFVDGAKKFDYLGNRLELMTGRGNIILMKDDHKNPTGIWCNPDMDCENDVFENKYAKHTSEQRPYCGPPTPCQHKSKPKLDQSGIHIGTLGGHYWYGDDSVSSTEGVPAWHLPFTLSEDDRCLGKTEWGSMTGHSIKLNDWEDEPGNRGDGNGIRIESAAGQVIAINDQTIDKKRAGPNRGILIRSSALGELLIEDKDNEQASPERCGPGVPTKEAKDAVVHLRSGYGLILKFTDSHQQKTTESQTIQLLAPNFSDRKGSHLLQMQLGGGTGLDDETGGAAGGINGSMVLLRSGNVMVYSSRSVSIEAVGDSDNTDATAHKFVAIKGHHVVQSDGVYVNVNKLALIKSDDYIILAAGEDCEEDLSDFEANGENVGKKFTTAIDGFDLHFNSNNEPPATEEEDEGPKKGPCLYPIILAKDAWPCPYTGFIHFGLGCGEGGTTHNAMSNRCFASTNPNDEPICQTEEEEESEGEEGEAATA